MSGKRIWAMFFVYIVIVGLCASALAYVVLGAMREVLPLLIAILEKAAS